MRKKIYEYIKQQMARLSLLRSAISQKHIKRHVRKQVKNYLHAVIPPYVREDIPHLIGTAVVVFAILLFPLMHIYKHTFASNASGIHPTKPQILVGGQAPYTHAEQGTVHIYWLASTDPVGIAGYRIYRNGEKVGETQDVSFKDYGISGTLTYTVEAYDTAGNTSSSLLHIILPSTWTAHVSPSDAVLSGFVLNRQNNTPIANAMIVLDKGKPVYTTNNGYFYIVFPDTTGQVQLSLHIKGYQDQTELVTLQKGQSVSKTIYLAPATPSLQEDIGSFFKKIFQK